MIYILLVPKRAMELIFYADCSDVVKLLLLYDADATISDENGNCPLHLAAWSGHAHNCETLLLHTTANLNRQVLKV